MSEISVLSFGYEIQGYESSVLEFGYAIAEDNRESAELSFGYEIVPSSVDTWYPTVTPVGYLTQLIGNNFPYWHAARRLEGGKTQRVINSLAGFHLTELDLSSISLKRSMYLKTCATDEPGRGWIFARPIAKSAQKSGSNLLRNPTFSKCLHFRDGPLFWDITSSSYSEGFELVEDEGLFDKYALRLRKTTAISQTVYSVIRKSTKFTATVWYAGMRKARGFEASRKSGPKLIVGVRYADNTYETFSEVIKDDTSGKWNKAYVTVTPRKDTHSIDFIISISPLDGEEVCIDIGGALLEQKNTTDLFSFNPDDGLPLTIKYPKEEHTATLVGPEEITYSRVPATVIKDDKTFDELAIAIPDRCVLSDETPKSAYSTEIFGGSAETNGNVSPTGWRVEDNLIAKYDALSGRDDTLETFAIADLLYTDGEFLYHKASQLGVENTIEALTVYNKKLYVVVKETYRGVDRRLLKVVEPFHRWEHDNQLECIKEILVPTSDGTCIFIGSTDCYNEFVLTIDDEDIMINLVKDEAASLEGDVVLFLNDITDGVLTV